MGAREMYSVKAPAGDEYRTCLKEVRLGEVQAHRRQGNQMYITSGTQEVGTRQATRLQTGLQEVLQHRTLSVRP